MDKKDIYEHLAKIYLDASSKKKGNKKTFTAFPNSLVFVGAAFLLIIVVAISLPNIFRNKPPFDSEVALVLLTEAAKINFHLNPAKKETYTLNLNNLDISRFKALGFSVKKANYKNLISLRVEFTNVYKERAEIYFKDIPYRWQDYRISLSNFKGISDWSEMLNLSFVIEEWNVKDKTGVVYIDNVRLLK